MEQGYFDANEQELMDDVRYRLNKKIEEEQALATARLERIPALINAITHGVKVGVETNQDSYPSSSSYSMPLQAWEAIVDAALSVARGSK